VKHIDQLLEFLGSWSLAMQHRQETMMPHCQKSVQKQFLPLIFLKLEILQPIYNNLWRTEANTNQPNPKNMTVIQRQSSIEVYSNVDSWSTATIIHPF
jgi:hypothetical protein